MAATLTIAHLLADLRRLAAAVHDTPCGEEANDLRTVKRGLSAIIKQYAAASDSISAEKQAKKKLPTTSLFTLP